MFSDLMISRCSEDGAILGYAVEIAMPDQMFRAHTGIGEILIDGVTYYGVGNLGEVSALDSEGDEKPASAQCTLNGLNIELVNEALKSKMIGNSAQILLLVFDSETNRLKMAEPAMVGFVSDYNIGMGEATGTVIVTISDEFELYERPGNKYWTDENHKTYHDGDRICRYVAQMGERKIYWGYDTDAVKFNTVA